MRSCSSLTAIRKLAKSNLELEEEVLDAMAPTKALLQYFFTRLQLKNVNFRTFEAALKNEMDELWKNILTVDDTLTPEISKKVEVQTKEKYNDFVQQHCKVRHYMFSVKECRGPSCICKPPGLPEGVFDSLFHLPDPCPDGEHYKDFEALYGKETSEEHRPSLWGQESKSSGMPFTPTA